MKKLIIVGAGGCGREVLQWALSSPKNNREWVVAGFIDDGDDPLKGLISEYKVLGKITDWEPKPNELFVCAIGNPFVKKMLIDKLKSRGATFESVIHPTAIVVPTATVGEGVIIYPYTVVSDNAVVGDHVILNMHNTIGHDAHIGAYSTLSSFCDVMGHVRLGESVFAGSSVKIIPNVTVGDNAFLCVGSVIMSHVKEGTKVLGYPAKRYQIGSTHRSGGTV